MRISRLTPYAMLAPFFLLFLGFFIYPFFHSFYLSLQANKMGSQHFVGFSNYMTALRDTSFWSSISTVFYYAILQALTMLLVGLFLALLLDSPLVRGKAFFRLTYFLPYAVPGVIAAIMWGFLYSPQLNPLLKALYVFNDGESFTIMSAGHLIYLITNIVTWEGAGYCMTLYFSALTALPSDMYEAAKIDGCNEFQLALKVKLPALKPMILFTSILSLIGSIQLFNEPFLLKSLGDVPPNFTPNLYTYNMAFTYGNFNYSATLAFLLAFVTLIASILFFYLTSGEQRRERRKQRQSRSNSAKARGLA